MNWQIASAGRAVGPAAASATKVFGTEFAVEAYRLLMEVLGANAQVRSGSPGEVLAGRIERMHRAALILTFGGGTNEIQRDIIAAAALGLPAVLAGGADGLHVQRGAGRARGAGQEDPGRAGRARGPTSPRPACSRPGCPRRSAGRGSACSSSVRCWSSSAGPSPMCPTSPRSCSGPARSPSSARRRSSAGGRPGRGRLGPAHRRAGRGRRRRPAVSFGQRAVRTAGRWGLSGVKTAVPAAPRADLFLVPAHDVGRGDGVPGLAVGRRGNRGTAAADGFRRGRAGRPGRRHTGRTGCSDRARRSRTGWWRGPPWGCARCRPGSSSGRWS